LGYAASRQVSTRLPIVAARVLIAHADSGFLHGLQAACTICVATCLLGVIVVLAFLPAHLTRPRPNADGRLDVVT